MSKAPVLILAFNRPEDLSRVLTEVQKYQPSHLLVACDGPRANRPSDVTGVEQSRAMVAEMVNWPCRCSLRFRETNLGCRAAVLDALEWGFSLEETLIVLEDDCVPTNDFFRISEELLTRYADEPQVASISGVNLSGCSPQEGSYYFSRFFHCWGWASWARIWRQRQNDQLFEKSNFEFLNELHIPTAEKKFWKAIAREIVNGRLDSWAYEFSLLSLKHGWLNTIPAESLVENIGYADSATHTKGVRPSWLLTGNVPFPLVHPQLAAWAQADDVVSRRIFQKVGLLRRIFLKIKRTFKPILAGE